MVCHRVSLSLFLQLRSDCYVNMILSALPWVSVGGRSGFPSGMKQLLFLLGRSRVRREETTGNGQVVHRLGGLHRVRFFVLFVVIVSIYLFVFFEFYSQ